MSKLTDILDRFNRTERNLLIRDILGHSSATALPLSDGFRDRIGQALGLTIPQDAWWATDYHLNWIAGAVSVWRDGEQKSFDGYENTDVSENQMRRLVERNQEDADLLIAFDQTLILVEVKAFGYFNNAQIDSKAQRWKLLKALCDVGSPHGKPTIHFMLMSRTAPVGLNKPLPELMPPGSADGSRWPHAQLVVSSASEKLVVTGRRPGSKPSEPKSTKWFIVRVYPTKDGKTTPDTLDEMSGPDAD